MNSDEVISVIKKSWFDLEEKFRSQEIITEQTIEENVGYTTKRKNDRSLVRKCGSEAFFHSSFFAEIEKNLSERKEMVPAVEDKRFEKDADITINRWDRNERELTDILSYIELKITGDYWIGRNDYTPKLQEEIEYCLDDEMIKEPVIPMFFCCFYESSPDEIKSKIQEYNSVLDWIIEERDFLIPEDYRENIIEAYAYRNHRDWDFIEN